MALEMGNAALTKYKEFVFALTKDVLAGSVEANRRSERIVARPFL
jgi:hypothetical protein